MRIDVLTLFPDMFAGVLQESIIGRAIKNDFLHVQLHNFRDFSEDKHNRVDDYAYGGGAGMVLRVEPIVHALRSIKGYEKALKIILSPQGKPYNQVTAYDFSEEPHIILLCGHYEGFDERIRNYFDLEISIGDYVLTGGELAAMVIIDSVARLLDGVISRAESHILDSFNNHLLEHPHYTRPREFEGQQVPEVLLNGHHEKIETWRHEQSIKRTISNRPDLYEKFLKESNHND